MKNVVVVFLLSGILCYSARANVTVIKLAHN